MKNKIVILNRTQGNYKGENAFYIGRGSVLGNPYSHLNLDHTIKCRSRDESIALYEQYIKKEMKKNPEIQSELIKMHRAAKVGPMFLVCYCAPKRCHGEIIRDILYEIGCHTNVQ